MSESKKLTLLEHYRLQRDYAAAYLEKSKPTLQQVWYYQELTYRINVLEVFQTFLMAAPESADTKVLIPHFQLFEAYVLCLVHERKIGRTDNKDLVKQQQTAHENLKQIFDSNKARFSRYAPRSAEQYHTDIETFTNTILPAWIQYRNTLLEISTKEAK